MSTNGWVSLAAIVISVAPMALNARTLWRGRPRPCVVCGHKRAVHIPDARDCAHCPPFGARHDYRRSRA